MFRSTSGLKLSNRPKYCRIIEEISLGSRKMIKEVISSLVYKQKRKLIETNGLHRSTHNLLSIESTSYVRESGKEYVILQAKIETL